MSRRHSVVAGNVTAKLNIADGKMRRLLLEKADLPLGDLLTAVYQKTVDARAQYEAATPKTQLPEIEKLSLWVPLGLPVGFGCVERLDHRKRRHGEGEFTDSEYRELVSWSRYAAEEFDFSTDANGRQVAKTIFITVKAADVRALTGRFDGAQIPRPEGLHDRVPVHGRSEYTLQYGALVCPPLLKMTADDEALSLWRELRPRVVKLYKAFATVHYLTSFGTAVADYLTTPRVALAVWPELARLPGMEYLKGETPTSATPAFRAAMDAAGMTKREVARTLKQVVDLVLQSELLPDPAAKEADGGYEYDLQAALVSANVPEKWCKTLLS